MNDNKIPQAMYNTIGKIKYGEVRIERRPAEYNQKGRLNTA